ncbi:MAG TPA: ATP-grasp domain-containing protein [Candidatus Saccharimonadales bacterium]|nr:ATP-grasp domain-containing protein [Candidatus Saccharimonadales bacterium]
MSHFLIVGQKFKSLIDYLSTHGHTYTFLQDQAKTKFPDKKFKNRVLADFSTKESVLRAVGSLSLKIDGVITTYENYVLPAAWIAEHLGLPGLPVTAAEACTDKYLMRSRFARAKEKISPDFAEVDNEDELRSFAAIHTFPLILKPANLAKSLLVTKNDSLEELLANYHKSTGLLGTVYKKYAPNREPKLIVEEFLEGSIHSVDAFIDNEGVPYILEPVVDYQTGYDIGHEDNFHYSRILPSKLSASDQKALRHCADIGIRALEMKSSPAHVEIIMTKSGPRIVEIGARNGGYRERMHNLANGIDITGAALSLALGKIPDITPTKNEPCAVLELFPKNAGTFTGIANFEMLKSLPSLSYLSVKATPGDIVGKAADGYKMVAVVILHSNDKAVFEKDLAYVTAEVEVQTA